jgi:hypothetical protein
MKTVPSQAVPEVASVKRDTYVQKTTHQPPDFAFGSNEKRGTIDLGPRTTRAPPKERTHVLDEFLCKAGRNARRYAAPAYAVAYQTGCHLVAHEACTMTSCSQRFCEQRRNKAFAGGLLLRIDVSKAPVRGRAPVDESRWVVSGLRKRCRAYCIPCEAVAERYEALYS